MISIKEILESMQLKRMVLNNMMVILVIIHCVKKIVFAYQSSINLNVNFNFKHWYGSSPDDEFT